MPIPAPVATNLSPSTAATQTLQKPAALLTREASTAHPHHPPAHPALPTHPGHTFISGKTFPFRPIR